MKKPDEHPILRALQSVLAAFFGVQSEKNMQKDLKQRDPYAFIIMGIVCAAIFVLVLIFIVRSLVGDSA